MPDKKEKPVTMNRAVVNERYQEAMREAQKNVRNPYDNDCPQRKKALDYLKQNDIELKPLRKQ